MVKTILSGAGFTEGKTFKETRFMKPPKTTYAIYLDAYESRGADALNLLKEHTYTVEVYSSEVDPDAEKRIEDELNKRGIEYEKDPREWLESENLYQVIYTFDFIEK